MFMVPVVVLTNPKGDPKKIIFNAGDKRIEEFKKKGYKVASEITPPTKELETPPLDEEDKDVSVEVGKPTAPPAKGGKKE